MASPAGNHVAPLERVRRLSVLMQAMIVAGAGLALGGLTWAWLAPGVAERFLPQRLDMTSVVVTGDVRIAGFLISLLPLSILFYGLYQAHQMFAGYRRGEVFTDAAAERMRGLAYSLVGVAIAHPIAQAALSVVLTWHAGPGHRQLSISLSSNDYFLAALGVLLLAIAQVMREAVRIAEENREIV